MKKSCPDCRLPRVLSGCRLCTALVCLGCFFAKHAGAEQLGGKACLGTSKPKPPPAKPEEKTWN